MRRKREPDGLFVFYSSFFGGDRSWKLEVIEFGMFDGLKVFRVVGAVLPFSYPLKHGSVFG